MKKIFTALLFFTLISYSQEYKFGAGLANGTIFKTEGSLSITETKVIFETIFKDKKTVTEYDVIKKTNGMLYFTDGVMKHYFTFIEEKGTKKGFDYDTMVSFNFDKSQSALTVIYFCKLQE